MAGTLAFIARIRDEITPHLSKLGDIERTAAADAEAGERALAAFIADLIRGGASPADSEGLLRAIAEQLEAIQNVQKEIIVSQSDIDAATSALTSATTTISGVAADLETAEANIQAEITALQNANPGLDTSALNAAVAGLSAPLSALQAADTSVDSLETPAAPAAPEPSAS